MTSSDTLDVLIIGAGFSGVQVLYSLRNAGFKVKIVEKGSSLGGVWHWNRYPGARVDSDGYYYQFSHPNLREKWEYSERFPGREELVEYFKFLDKEWDLSKDITFGTEVLGAQWDEETTTWNVRTKCGGEEKVYKCHWFIAAVGFATTPYTPAFKGLESFKGPVYHTSDWPADGADFKGKRVAVIGTGASGIQVIQTIGPDVAHLTVYQRTPNLALPMKQEPWSTFKMKNHLDTPKAIDDAFKDARMSFGGVHFTVYPKNTADDTLEENHALWETLYDFGGLRFWVTAYQDLFLSQEANDKAYAFWAKKTRERVKDPKKRDILAPLKAPHPYGTKRPSLEQYFYEVCDMPHVDVIDVSADPIEEMTERGIKTSSGEVEVDAIVLATGFDSITAPLTDLELIGTDGMGIRERWKDGLQTYLGMSVAKYPNFFFMYGPQAPTAFSNGTTSAEFQSEWITRVIEDMRKQGVKRLECTEESQQGWTAAVDGIWNMTLFPKAKSWYQGSNIPGKVVQALNWPGGVPAYLQQINDCRDNDYKGFVKS